jgi:chorismate mutase
MKEMRELRSKIDKIDAEIIKKLSQRIVIAKKIGALKVKLGKEVLDKKRELQIERLHKRLSKKYKLNPKFVNTVFKTIVLYSRGVQK